MIHYTGLGDEIPDFSEEQKDMFGVLKRKAGRATADLSNKVRSMVNPDNVRAWVEEERMAALGVAGGAVIGLVI